MNTQEYIQKEVKEKYNNRPNWEKFIYIDGLSSGIELAKEAVMKLTLCTKEDAAAYIELLITEKQKEEEK